MLQLLMMSTRQVILDVHKEFALLYYLPKTFNSSESTDFSSVKYICPASSLYPIPNSTLERHFNVYWP